MFPIISALADGGTTKCSAGHSDNIQYGALADTGSIASFGSSVQSLDTVWQPASASAAATATAAAAAAVAATSQADDLYSWMAKAHHATKKASTVKNKRESLKRPPSPPSLRASGAVLGGLAAGISGAAGAGGASINGQMQDSTRLLDAHLIFEPILTCLGVMPQQMVNNITNSGKANHSLGAHIGLLNENSAF